MAIRTGTTKRNGRAVRKQALLVMGAAALIVAALATLSVRQLGGRQGSTASGGSAAAQPMSAASTGSGTDGGALRPITLYLAGSAEQAGQVYTTLREQNALRAKNGALDQEASVRVVTSPDEAAQVRDAAATLNTVRAHNGLAPIEVVDLRPVALASEAAPVTPQDPVLPR